jgi:hypothetical protein
MQSSASLLLLGAWGVLLSTAQSTGPTARQAESSIRIRGSTYGGNACPQGSIGSFFGGGKLLVTTEPFVAAIGYGRANDTKSVACQYNLDLVTVGSQFTFVPNATQRFIGGVVLLDEGVSAQIREPIFFSGGKDQVCER